MRPDNAPICAFVASDNGPAFVTLRGGGLFVVDHTATPMGIVGEYDLSAIGPNGCGAVEANGRVFLNAGGGTATNLDEFTVYRLPMTGYSAANAPNTPARELLFQDLAEHRDAHGPVATKGRALSCGCWIEPATSRKCSMARAARASTPSISCRATARIPPRTSR